MAPALTRNRKPDSLNKKPPASTESKLGAYKTRHAMRRCRSLTWQGAGAPLHPHCRRCRHVRASPSTLLTRLAALDPHPHFGRA
jgi:hypothetical protein